MTPQQDIIFMEVSALGTFTAEQKEQLKLFRLNAI